MVSKANTTAARQIPASFKAAAEYTVVRELHGNKKVSLCFQLAMRGTVEDVRKAFEEVRNGQRLADGKPQFLTVKELTAIFGARDEDVAKLKKLARQNGLSTKRRTRAHKVHGHVVIGGRYNQMKSLLPGLRLNVGVDKDGKDFIVREGMYSIVAEAPQVVGIFDGDNRRAFRSYCRPVMEDLKPVKFSWGLAEGVAKPHAGREMTARENAIAFGFPADQYNNDGEYVTGYGSLGGDNVEIRKDAKTLLDERHLPTPHFYLESIGGAKNGKYSDDATVENVLDLLEHALLNPSGHIVAFIADNDDNAFAEAMETAAVYKGVKVGNKLLKMLAFSWSWGQAEEGFSVQSLQRWARALATARLSGLTVTAATGDDGSRDKTSKPQCDMPSGVTGMIGAAGIGFSVDANGMVSEIHIWPSTGGGVSIVFEPMPEERKANVVFKSLANGREGHNASLIAYEAEPNSGPVVLHANRRFRVGGTSDAAPGLATMIGRIQYEMLKKHGVIVPDFVTFIYENHDKGIFFKLSEEGSNGDYSQKPDDVCGVPVGFGPFNYKGMLAAADAVCAGLAKKKASARKAA
jgi:kumamolisin